MDKRDYEEALEELAVGSLAADLAQAYPDSYSKDDVLDISARLYDASDKADELMRDDFAALTPMEQERLIDLLDEHSEQTRQWWRDYLL
jgi:hypothetical protein